MTYRLRGLIPFGAITSLTLTVACGGSVFTTEDDATGGGSAGGSHSGGAGAGGSGDGGSSSGGTGAGGTSSGGASTGGSSSGGASTGGSGGTPIVGDCNVDSDCVAVLDAAAPCYSPGCSSPEAASEQDVSRNHCLVLWENRSNPAPEDCASPDPGGCPELCAAEPTCVTPTCNGGTCELILGYSLEQCEIPPSDCSTLNEKRQAALDAARACNPDLDNIQCNATETVEDMCGCPVIVNETQPELVKTAREAREAWAASCTAACPLALCALPVAGACGSDGVCASK